MSLMATRVNAELVREEFLRQRLDEQRGVLDRQQADLAATEQVLTAMNAAFGLIGECDSTPDLLERQVRLLKGILGYEGVAVLRLTAGGGLEGPVAACQGRKLSQASLPADKATPIYSAFSGRAAGRFRFELDCASLKALLRCDHVGVGCLVHEGQTIGVLAFGRQSPTPANDRLHATHLEAILDQVSLLISTHLLHDELLVTNTELRSTQQGLVQSEKLSAVGTLAASTAHDIRNILSSLSMQLGSDEVDPREALGSVREQLDRFAVLAHRLLSYARPGQIAKEPTDVNAVIERVLALTGPQLRVYDVTVVDKRAVAVPLILADPRRLEHLFVNLVLNAVQAISPDGGRLTIATMASDGRVTVKITDTGKGIPADALPGLFEPFRTTRKEGFGLGLYSCKHIVEEHGGSIAASRGLLKGTAFTIVLPVE